MITTILITLVVTVVMASMYWQPSFGSGSSEEPKRPQRTPREEYIIRIYDLIRKGEYSTVRSLLEKPEYPLDKLPLADWRRSLTAERIAIEDLEDILK